MICLSVRRIATFLLPVLLVVPALVRALGLSSFHPDMITLPLTPDTFTLLQHTVNIFLDRFLLFSLESIAGAPKTME